MLQPGKHRETPIDDNINISVADSLDHFPEISRILYDSDVME